ncbi:histidine phosphatase family protein [Dongia sedimenti]|uniref:Histidine phosphatase family protein n=1 Tax=Dongia sedimenti TaxID=3064282 RepID=A0ABU0YUV8_9PROT|nr:histidine phosphatase family protein [Rhodospirillaceae bacterium R-7]
MTRTVTRWWWVRHAPMKDAGGRVTGQLDLEADCSDHEAIARIAVRLPQNPVWMSSQLRRARQTLEVLHTACGITGAAVEVERDVAEQDFGDWQGQTYAALEQSDADRYKKFWIAPGTTRPPGGESFADVMMRVARAVERRSASHPDADIVVVGHGGSIRAAVAQALGLGPARALALQVDPLSLTRLDRIADQSGVVWSIGCVNA